MKTRAASANTTGSIDRAVHLVQSVDPNVSITLSVGLSDEERAMLCDLPAPLHIIGIGGATRTGKSTLASIILTHGANLKVFEIGHQDVAKTKGLWMAAMPHPSSGGTVLLIDSEGMHDANYGSAGHNFDSHLFALLVTMCSTVILNVDHRVSADILQQLCTCGELAQQIADRKDGNREDDVQYIYPALYVVVRNHALALPDRHPSYDSYFEELLTVHPTAGGYPDPYEKSKTTIKELFLERYLKPLVFPCKEDKGTLTMDEQTVHDFRPEFAGEVLRLVDEIIANTPAKTLWGSGRRSKREIDGSMFLEFLEAAILNLSSDDGGIFLPNLVDDMVERFNRLAINDAVAAYATALEAISFPVDQREMLTQEGNARVAAKSALRAKSVMVTADQVAAVNDTLSGLLDGKLREAKQRNKDATHKLALEVIQELRALLDSKKAKLIASADVSALLVELGNTVIKEFHAKVIGDDDEKGKDAASLAAIMVQFVNEVTAENKHMSAKAKSQANAEAAGNAQAARAFAEEQSRVSAEAESKAAEDRRERLITDLMESVRKEQAEAQALHDLEIRKMQDQIAEAKHAHDAELVQLREEAIENEKRLRKISEDQAREFNTKAQEQEKKAAKAREDLKQQIKTLDDKIKNLPPPVTYVTGGGK